MQHASTFKPALRWVAPLAIAVAGHAAQAADSITDPVGDFLPTFAGSTASTDLDVIGATVTYNASTDIFTFSSTQVGNVGLTPTGIFVWGVNRGNGVASFAANGITGVLFDSVLILRPNGSSTVGANTLPAGAVTFAGNTITAVVSGALFPSTGFAKSAYTFNVWPRDSALPSGFGQISDFAPNNSNFTAVPVPEPATVLLMAVGAAGLLAWRRRASV
jgi:hypothetical protein